MKLLSAALSPFAARVRMAIYAGGLPVEIAPSNMWASPGVKSEAFLAINPIGKVPALVLDDGSALPESETILEYLADAFPDAGLRPETAQDIARGRLLARITELYVATPAFGLFGQLFSPERDPKVIAAAFAEVDKGLGFLEGYMTGDAYAVGDRLTLADCAMVPYLYFFAVLFGRTLGDGSRLQGRPKLEAYWSRIQADPVTAKVLAEMNAGLAESRLSMLLGEPAPAA